MKKGTNYEATKTRLLKKWYENEGSGGGINDYIILTDEEADAMCEECILDSVWAFRPSFLAYHTEIDEKIIEHFQEKCESANEPLKRMIKDIDYFVADAIKSDGRGNFMSAYDGDEHEVYDKVSKQYFFIYRID